MLHCLCLLVDLWSFSSIFPVLSHSLAYLYLIYLCDWSCCLFRFFLPLCHACLFSLWVQSFPKSFMLCPTGPERCLFSLCVRQICKSCVWVNGGKKRLWSWLTLSSDSRKACLFLDLPHNNTRASPHTHYLAHTAHRAHWENKRQP